MDEDFLIDTDDDDTYEMPMDYEFLKEYINEPEKEKNEEEIPLGDNKCGYQDLVDFLKTNDKSILKKLENYIKAPLESNDCEEREKVLIKKEFMIAFLGDHQETQTNNKTTTQ